MTAAFSFGIKPELLFAFFMAIGFSGFFFIFAAHGSHPPFKVKGKIFWPLAALPMLLSIIAVLVSFPCSSLLAPAATLVLFAFIMYCRLSNIEDIPPEQRIIGNNPLMLSEYPYIVLGVMCLPLLIFWSWVLGVTVLLYLLSMVESLKVL